jgi:putative ABC transport system ATP-binding protein
MMKMISNTETMPENSTLIRFDGITKVYGTGHAAVVAMDHVDFSVGRGEFVAVMGPSGSGKSTCMNILGCLDSPSAGDYLFEGVNVSKLTRNQRALLRRHYIGFVFQGYNLLNRTTALENVELPLFYRGVPARKRKTLARGALDAVGLLGWERHTQAELSGGQQQRVAIARALVSEPKVLLADEPTGNLDSARSREIMNLLSTLNQDTGITIVMVTHEQEAAEYARRIIHFMDGKIENDMPNGGNS